jgi:hypothetical protein
VVMEGETWWVGLGWVGGGCVGRLIRRSADVCVYKAGSRILELSNAGLAKAGLKVIGPRTNWQHLNLR